jgi:hypothetical protein
MGFLIKEGIMSKQDPDDLSKHVFYRGQVGARYLNLFSSIYGYKEFSLSNYFSGFNN